jgi:iron complex transport system ATP-binding protein
MTVEITDATFGYGDEPVFEDVTLAVETGQLLGLLGPNGSGKTTLLRTMNRILDLDSGIVELDGVEVGSLSRDAVARRVGFVPQNGGDAGRSTVFETVLLGRKPHFGWRPTDEDRAAVRAALSELGLSELAERELGSLSGGQRRAVLVARALVQATDALLLDEPTAGLDVRHQLEVLRVVRQHLRREQLAGVVAIHDLTLASRFCDRFALLADGTLQAVGGPAVLTPETVEQVYGVSIETVERDGRTLVLPVDPVDDGRHVSLAGQTTD